MRLQHWQVATAICLTIASASGDCGATQACPQLNVLTWEGYTDDLWLKPFEQKFHVAVKPLYVGSGDEEVAKLKAGGGDLFDVVSISLDNLKAMIGTGAVAPLDTARLSNFSEYLPFLAHAAISGGATYAAPYTWDVNPFVYNIDTFLQLGLSVPPTSFDVLWDKRLRGRVAVWDEISTLYLGATVLGYDANPRQIFDMSEDQLDAVLDKLVSLKPNIRKLWQTGGEAIDLYVNHEVAAGLSWTYVYREARKRGVNLGRVVFADHGAQAWLDGFGVTRGRPDCKDLAYALIDYLTSASVNAQAAQQMGYAPANAKSLAFLDPQAIKDFHLDKPDAFFKQVIFKVDPVHRDQYLEALNAFKAAP